MWSCASAHWSLTPKKKWTKVCHMTVVMGYKDPLDVQTGGTDSITLLMRMVNITYCCMNIVDVIITSRIHLMACHIIDNLLLWAEKSLSNIMAILVLGCWYGLWSSSDRHKICGILTQNIPILARLSWKFAIGGWTSADRQLRISGGGSTWNLGGGGVSLQASGYKVWVYSPEKWVVNYYTCTLWDLMEKGPAEIAIF